MIPYFRQTDSRSVSLPALTSTGERSLGREIERHFMNTRLLLGALALTLPAFGAPKLATPTPAPAGKPATPAEVAKSAETAPSAFERWTKPLHATEHSLQPVSARVLTLDKEVTALLQRRAEAEAAAAQAEKAARAAFGPARAAHDAYEKPGASAVQAGSAVQLERARAGYREALAQGNLLREKLQAVRALNAALGVKMDAASQVAIEAQAAKASITKARDELRIALRRARDEARMTGRQLGAASRQAGFERKGSFEERKQAAAKADAELEAKVQGAGKALQEVEASLKTQPTPPAKETTRTEKQP